MSAELVLAGPAATIREKGHRVVTVGGTPVLVLWHDGAFHALDNRCPHMGFPLHTGDTRDGLLACHWHHARFDITCGATLDPWADDAAAYRVEVRGDEVYVDPTRPPRDPREHGSERLGRGLMDNLGLVAAKAIIELDEGDIEPELAMSIAARWGATQRSDGWQPGLSVLTAMVNVLPALDAEDRQRALVHGVRFVARDCAGRPPRHPLPDLSGSGRDRAGLRQWLCETINVRDARGAERVLFTLLVEHGTTAALDAVLAACTDHRYADVGHTLDYAIKCAELAERMDDATDQAQLFTSLVPQMAQMRRMEETSAWRSPVDVAALVDAAWDDVPEEPFARPGGTVLPDSRGLAETLVADDPEGALAAIVAHLSAGVSPVALADAVVLAAILRVLRFGTSNEATDWDTVHHTLTYANAVAEAMRRAPSRDLFRAVLDGAMSVYLDRFLNLPPAPLPASRAAVDDAATLLPELLDAYDRRSSIDEAASIARAYLENGGDPRALLGTLGKAVLREDAGFHSFQQLEIAWRQLERHGQSEQGRLALVATARWIAAQFPTRRAMEQTFSIARRLHRGDSFEA